MGSSGFMRAPNEFLLKDKAGQQTKNPCSCNAVPLFFQAFAAFTAIVTPTLSPRHCADGTVKCGWRGMQRQQRQYCPRFWVSPRHPFKGRLSLHVTAFILHTCTAHGAKHCQAAAWNRPFLHGEKEGVCIPPWRNIPQMRCCLH